MAPLRLAVLSVIGVILSLGGIYAVMSFTVARRTREIGVRVALGAPRIRVVLAIFRRPLIQVCTRLLAGGLLVTVILLGPSQSPPTLKQLAALAA